MSLGDFGTPTASKNKMMAEMQSNMDNGAPMDLEMIGIFPPGVVTDQEWVTPLLRERMKTKNSLGQPQLLKEIVFNGTNMMLSCRFADQILQDPYGLQNVVKNKKSGKADKDTGNKEKTKKPPVPKANSGFVLPMGKKKSKGPLIYKPITMKSGSKKMKFMLDRVLTMHLI